MNVTIIVTWNMARGIGKEPMKRARELEAAGLPHMSVQGPLGTNFASALRVVS